MTRPATHEARVERVSDGRTVTIAPAVPHPQLKQGVGVLFLPAATAAKLLRDAGGETALVGRQVRFYFSDRSLTWSVSCTRAELLPENGSGPAA